MASSASREFAPSDQGHSVDAYSGIPTRKTMQPGEKYNFPPLPEDRSKPVNLQCQCGAVHITVPFQPKDVNPCPCTVCWRLGVFWAYYDHGTCKMSVDGKSVVNEGHRDNPGWPDAIEGILHYHNTLQKMHFGSCARCGTTLYWKMTQSGYEEEQERKEQSTTAINWRLAGPRALQGVYLWEHPTDDGEAL